MIPEFIIIIISFLFSIIICSALISINNLSGGALRSLEDHNKQVVEKLEKLLQKVDRLRVTMRIIIITFFLSISYHMHIILGDRSLSYREISMMSLAGILFLIFTELLGNKLPLLLSCHFLNIILPVINIVSIPLLPILIPLQLLQQKDNSNHTSAEDEIMSLIEQDEDNNDHTDLEEDEKRMIKGVLDLDETYVREIMTPRVDMDACDISRTISYIKELIISSGHSRVPIYNENIDKIIGVIYAKDLLSEKLNVNSNIKPLLHKPIFIPETKNVGDLLAEFQQTNNHFAVVLDEYGGTSGIITFEDILEEIVGEIRDEYDFAEQQPLQKQLPNGNLVIDARTPVTEINELYDLGLPEDEDYDTLGGYITALTGRIPKKGEVINTELLTLTITKADARCVQKVLVKSTNKTNPEK